MKRAVAALALTFVIALGRPDGVLAQQGPGCWLRGATPAEAAQRASPRDSAQASLAGGMVKICYGSPSAREREIMGGLVPYGAPWRMGADEATALHLTVPATVAGVRLDPGTYSLFGIPTSGEWTVVVNHDHERWGIPISDAVRAHDLGEGRVAAEGLPDHVERLRYRFEPAGEGRVDLVMEWERTRIRVPIQHTGH